MRICAKYDKTDVIGNRMAAVLKVSMFREVLVLVYSVVCFHRTIKSGCQMNRVAEAQLE